MNASRLWTLGSILLVIALIAGTWFIGIAPKLAEARAADDSRVTVQAQNTSHAATLASLEEQFKGIDKLRDSLDELRVALPSDDATSELLRQLEEYAASSGVQIAGLSFAPPTEYLPPAEPSADTELAAAQASVDPSRFLSIAVELKVVGGYDQVMAFLAQLQGGSRLFLVSDLSLNEGIPATAEYTIGGLVYALLDESPAAAEEVVVSPEAPASAEGTTLQ